MQEIVESRGVVDFGQLLDLYRSLDRETDRGMAMLLPSRFVKLAPAILEKKGSKDTAPMLPHRLHPCTPEADGAVARQAKALFNFIALLRRLARR